jgi:hypothetical protein
MQSRALAPQARQELRGASETEDRTAEDVQGNRYRIDHGARVRRDDHGTAEQLGNPEQSEHCRDERVKEDQGKECPFATGDDFHSSVFLENGLDCVSRACARR